MVLAVVVLERFCRDVRLERVFGIGKLGKLVLCHDYLPSWVVR
jgi:hypothetical protein